jgi:hypothetical protein
VLATLPGRLRDWADVAIAASGGIATHDLLAEPAFVPVDRPPSAILMDEPGSAIADLMELGLGAMESAGRIAAILSLATDWPPTARSRLVFRTAGDTAASLRDSLGEILELPPCATPPPDLPAARRLPGGLALQLAEVFIAPLQAFAAGSVQAVLTWPRASFRLGTPPQETSPERVELVGPARSVVYGPYLPLPAGWWEAELRLYFSEEACWRTFTVDMIAEELVGTIRLKPVSAGTFRMRMLFHNPRADWPLALRVVLEHGAIDGRMGLESVTLRHTRSQGTAASG